jgi:hypothetical protein
VGTESGSTVSTLGIYENDKEKGYVSAYDVNFPNWASMAETWWQIHAAHSYIAGGLCGPASITAADRRPTDGRASVHNSAFSIPAVFPRKISTTKLGGPLRRCCICSRTGTGPGKKARRSRSGRTRIWTVSSFF